MTPADAPTVFVIGDDAAVRAAIQGRPMQRWTQLSDRFYNRLLIKGVRERCDHAKGIANHALK
jgi:hypothetical protein